MELRQLRYFQTVAELASYTKAAALLRLSQPALSRSLKGLEEELGTALFIRAGRSIRLTESGEALLERSRRILREVEQTRSEISGSARQQTGHIGFGTPPAAGHILLPRLVENYRALYPRMILQVASGFSGYVKEWLLTDRIDVGVLHNPRPMKNLTMVPLLTEQTYVVGPAGAEFGRGGSVPLTELQHLPLILPSRANRVRSLLDDLAAKHQLRLNIGLEVDGLALITALVKRGLGYSVLTYSAFHEALARGEVSAKPIRPAMDWVLTMATRSDRPHARPVTDLMAAIPQTCAELVASGLWQAKLWRGR